MITHAVSEIKHHIDQKEVENAVVTVNAVQQGFRHDVLPYAKTYPVTGFDTGALDLLINDARKAIETLHHLILARAGIGDGTAAMILHRNLHGVVQCKLTMDRWRRGLTRAVVDEGVYETFRVVNMHTIVIRGLELMSDLSFSPGIIYFHVGGGGRPELTSYSYMYKGKAQPGSGSNPAPVFQAFIKARRAARDRAIPEWVGEWMMKANETRMQLEDLKDKVPE